MVRKKKGFEMCYNGKVGFGAKFQFLVSGRKTVTACGRKRKTTSAWLMKLKSNVKDSLLRGFNKYKTDPRIFLRKKN